jgi:hypothetical protein
MPVPCAKWEWGGKGEAKEDLDEQFCPRLFRRTISSHSFHVIMAGDMRACQCVGEAPGLLLVLLVIQDGGKDGARQATAGTPKLK